MIDTQGIMQPPFSHERESCGYNNVQQSLCACILDAINNEIDVVGELISEGKKLIEDMDDMMNMKEITTNVKYLNNELYLHAIRMNTLKFETPKSN